MKVKILTAALVMMGFATNAFANNGVVNVYNWSDYIDEDILTEFEAQTGIKVVYDVYDSNEILETKLLAGNTGYDVVVPTGLNLKRQIQAGVHQKLDYSQLPNAENRWSEITDRLGDEVNEYSVNYMWGTTGIGYNVEKIKSRMPDAPLDSWAMVFDPEVLKNFADCGVHLLDSPDDIVTSILAYLGEDPASHDVEVLKKAQPILEGIRPYIQKFHSSEYINALASGDICMAVGFSGDIFQARDRASEVDNGVEIAYIIPKEGALMWFDQMAVPADAPNRENAHTFINYILQPEVVAKATNYVSYANGNKASQEFIDEEILSDAQIYPPQEVLENLYTISPFPPRILREVTRMWSRAKTGA